MCGAQTQKYIEMQATKCMRLQMTTGIFDFCFQLLLLILIFLSGISCALFQRLHFTHTHVYFYWRINMYAHALALKMYMKMLRIRHTTPFVL